MNRFRFLALSTAVAWDAAAAAPAAAPAAAAPAAPATLIEAAAGVPPPAAAPAAAAPATAAPPPAAAPGAAPAAVSPATPPAPGAPYIPEGLPKDLAGANERETLDKVAKHLAGLPKAPEKADGYAWEPSKEIAGLVNPKNDKVLPLARDVAHGLGLSQDQFNGFINGMYGKMMEAGMLAAPVQIDAEFQKLGGEAGDRATQIANGQKRVLDLAGQIDGLATRSEITPQQAAAMKGLVSNADAALGLERLLKLIPAAAGPQNGNRPGGAATPEAAQERAMAAMYPSMKKA